MTTNFEKTMLQQISDVAWLVHQKGEKLGILNKDVQEHYVYINGRDTVLFNNENEVVEHFGNITLFEEKIDKPSAISDGFFIKGYEVDYPNPFALDENHPDYRDDIPLYTKIEDSKVYYAAGYYCINFGKGWKHAHGPKLSTLLTYGFEGPFRTSIEVKQRNRILNKKSNTTSCL